MPAGQFFTMLDACRRLRNVEMSELCDIQAISICTTQWHENIKGRYKNDPVEEEQITRVMPANTIDLSKDSVAARNAMFSVFGNASKGLVM